MRFSTIGYSIKQGIKNLKRNRLFSLASIGTIMACLFLFGIFYFIIVNLHFMIRLAETNVGITVFFEEEVTETEIIKLQTELKGRPECSIINYITPEEAWERYRKKYLNEVQELVETFEGDNPLEKSASLEIYLNDIDLQKDFVKEIKSKEGVRKVESSELVAMSLSSLNVLVAYISVAVIMILLAVAIFLISTTITTGISIRKDEIAIMKLIGATDFFIRVPFIVEGILIGLIGAILPLLFLYFIYNSVISYVMVEFSILSSFLVFLPAKEIFQVLIPISLVIGVGIGFVGSFVIVRKHLNI